ncbi:hypothetical protein [Ascidiimonas sp. W6]|uniref:hypothetical protein n=1 Tax=Ascidiimonas meishanensis TaxID=3128903 RepID=UPI0030EB8F2A
MEEKKKQREEQGPKQRPYATPQKTQNPLQNLFAGLFGRKKQQIVPVAQDAPVTKQSMGEAAMQAAQEVTQSKSLSNAKAATNTLNTTAAIPTAAQELQANLKTGLDTAKEISAKTGLAAKTDLTNTASVKKDLKSGVAAKAEIKPGDAVKSNIKSGVAAKAEIKSEVAAKTEIKSGVATKELNVTERVSLQKPVTGAKELQSSVQQVTAKAKITPAKQVAKNLAKAKTDSGGIRKEIIEQKKAKEKEVKKVRKVTKVKIKDQKNKPTQAPVKPEVAVATNSMGQVTTINVNAFSKAQPSKQALSKGYTPQTGTAAVKERLKTRTKVKGKEARNAETIGSSIQMRR